ncbi:MAG: prealbumin-like fold domain-containing protein [Actinomycetota bacterium]|nr:prealbumin-like fold domain-containing protein [Actinomycetota bacterium]
MSWLASSSTICAAPRRIVADYSGTNYAGDCTKPLAGAFFQARGPAQASGTTDANGVVALGGLSAGTYTVTDWWGAGRLRATCHRLLVGRRGLPRHPEWCRCHDEDPCRCPDHVHVVEHPGEREGPAAGYRNDGSSVRGLGDDRDAPGCVPSPGLRRHRTPPSKDLNPSSPGSLPRLTDHAQEGTAEREDVDLIGAVWRPAPALKDDGPGRTA